MKASISVVLKDRSAVFILKALQYTVRQGRHCANLHFVEEEIEAPEKLSDLQGYTTSKWHLLVPNIIFSPPIYIAEIPQ